MIHKCVRAIPSHRYRRQPPDNPIELANQAPLPTTSGETLMFEDFSMKLAFFVLMGGYAHDFAPEDPKILPKTITPQGFISLCRDSKIKQHYLDVKLIEDKSKADGLAKFLVCMQALVSIYPPRVAPILNPFDSSTTNDHSTTSTDPNTKIPNPETYVQVWRNLPTLSGSVVAG